MRDIKDKHVEAQKAEAHQDPLVAAILESFPGSKVTVKTRQEQIPIEAYEDAFSREDEDE